MSVAPKICGDCTKSIVEREHCSIEIVQSNEAGMTTKSILSTLLFVKNHWFAWRENHIVSWHESNTNSLVSKIWLKICGNCGSKSENCVLVLDTKEISRKKQSNCLWSYLEFKVSHESCHCRVGVGSGVWCLVLQRHHAGLLLQNTLHLGQMVGRLDIPEARV